MGNRGSERQIWHFGLTRNTFPPDQCQVELITFLLWLTENFAAMPIDMAAIEDMPMKTRIFWIVGSLATASVFAQSSGGDFDIVKHTVGL